MSRMCGKSLLREAAQARLRAEAWQTHIGALAGLEAHVNALGPLDATDAMNEAAIETVWKMNRRGRVDLFLISNNLAALTALVMADLSETQRETLLSLIFQRGVELTAPIVDQSVSSHYLVPCSQVKPGESQLGSQIVHCHFIWRP